ncbi:MAG TPA: DEAD/DEAH box helicase family protein, partial [Aggregatilineales bacterium]|nr:DEAD/DEAH box helicase family protein [Aggregatilineales bacterium]
DENDERVFDSIIVVSDRRVLDRQLQRTVRQFEQVKGTVENIDKTSRDLKKALEDGKQIIVTTLQKFPVIANQVEELSGSRFALIIDEAHSSQSGESAIKLNQTLEVGSLEAAEEADQDTGEDMEDVIIREMQRRRHLPNVSTFAFTATPKAKTLELFGSRDERGRMVPFSLYTMRQAIDEKFIMDVLENYTTYQAYWRLFKTIEDDTQYEKHKVMRLLRQYVDLHEHAIREKIAIMVEHFHEKVAGKINGKAKAMIVTRSRLHTVRYCIELKKHLREQGYPYGVLVAFSGTVKDGELAYTETGMNGFSESQTARTFEQDQYRFLVVANKFQTGFDQPLLHTMYVDKVLGGVNAVQTLSRLNRIHPDKSETMVLDFANKADDIQRAFAPYYEKTLLSEETDPNILYEYQRQLEAFEIFTYDDVDDFAAVLWNPEATQDQLHRVLTPVVDVYKAADDDTQVDFQGKLRDYIRVYSFLSQVLTFADADLEKLYRFAYFLLRKLPVTREQLPLEVQQNIDLDSYRIRETFAGSIELERQPGELAPQVTISTYGSAAGDMELLSAIIQQLNDYFGLDLGDDARVTIQQMQERIAQDQGLKKSIEVNTPERARLTFNSVFKDILYDLFKSNFDFYKLLNDDENVRGTLQDWLFDWYRRSSAA